MCKRNQVEKLSFLIDETQAKNKLMTTKVGSGDVA